LSFLFHLIRWTPRNCYFHWTCENLVEQLLLFIPVKRGIVLDVACGKGATTRLLMRKSAFTLIVGINISMKQIRSCICNSPGASFLLMDATRLGFSDNCFDHIVCVEAAMHFKTRESFFGEAFRVLKPGGRLVLSDTLRKNPTHPTDLLIPSENYIKDAKEYSSLLMHVGFEPIIIRDATNECWASFYNFAIDRFRQELRSGALDRRIYTRAVDKLNRKYLAIHSYLLVCASKPE
jgi:MPBQ/MSBQ methyltransferase